MPQVFRKTWTVTTQQNTVKCTEKFVLGFLKIKNKIIKSAFIALRNEYPQWLLLVKHTVVPVLFYFSKRQREGAGSF